MLRLYKFKLLFFINLSSIPVYVFVGSAAARALQSARSAGVVRYGGGDGNPKRSQRSFSSKQMRRYSSPPRYRPPSNNNNHHNNNNGSERHHKKRRAYAPAPQR